MPLKECIHILTLGASIFQISSFVSSLWLSSPKPTNLLFQDYNKFNTHVNCFIGLPFNNILARTLVVGSFMSTFLSEFLLIISQHFNKVLNYGNTVQNYFVVNSEKVIHRMDAKILHHFSVSRTVMTIFHL